jgi:hypothetical protein
VNRRAFVRSLALGLLAAPLAAEAQRERTPRIGVLLTSSRSATSHVVNALRQGLHDHGWVDGTNIALEYRFGDGQLERLRELAAELVRLKVDVIVTGAAPATVAAAKTTASIPIVFWSVPVPLDLGLVASVARPGGNITGVSWDVNPETSAKTLQLFREIAPKVSRIAVMRQVSGLRPRFFGAKAANSPRLRARRHTTNCDVYNPSRRNSAPTAPGVAHASASFRMRRLYSAVYVRRLGFAGTCTSSATPHRLPVHGGIPSRPHQ